MKNTTATPNMTPGEATGDRALPDRVIKGGWYTLWVMLFLVLVANVDRQVLVLAGQPLAETLGLSDSQLGIVQGLAFAIFAVVAVYPIAWAADRFDRRLVFGLCVLIWSLGTAACGLAQNFEQLFVAAVLIAAGEAGLVPICIAFVPALFKGQKRLVANSILYFFGSMGVASGLVLGGGAIALLYGIHSELPAWLQEFEAWRLAFFLVALPTPLFLILIAYTRLGYRGEASQDEHTLQDGKAQTVQAEAPLQDFWPFLRQHGRAVVSIFAGIGFCGIGYGGYLVWLPIAATRMFETTPGQNGSFMGVGYAVGVVLGVPAGTFFVRRLIIKMGPVASIRFYRLVLMTGLPVLILFPFVETSWQLFTLFGLLMITTNAAGCVLPTMLQDMAPPRLVGRMAAMWGISTGLLGGLAPSLVGWTSDVLGSEPRMLLVALGLIAVPSWIVAALIFRASERPFEVLTRHAGGHDAVDDRAMAGTR